MKAVIVSSQWQGVKLVVHEPHACGALNVEMLAVCPQPCSARHETSLYSQYNQQPCFNLGV